MYAGPYEDRERADQALADYFVQAAAHGSKRFPAGGYEVITADDLYVHRSPVTLILSEYTTCCACSYPYHHDGGCSNPACYEAPVFD